MDELAYIPVAALDDLMEGCQVIGPDWRYLYVNDEAARHGRKGREELLGRTMMEVYPGIERTPMFALMTRCMKERVRLKTENEFAFPDGSSGWFELRFEPVPEGVLVLSLEHTEQKTAASALLESDERYRGLFEAAADVVFTIDPETGVLRSLNPAFERITGLAAADWVGRPYPEILHPDDAAPAASAFARALRGEAVPAVELRYRCRSGETRTGEFSVSPRVRNGKVVAVLGIARDITAYKKVEDQYRHAQKMEAVGRLAGGVAHDFNNVLSVIISYAGFLMDRFPEGDPARADAEEIFRAGTRGAGLSRQLLAFSRRQPAEKRPLAPGTLVKNMEKMLRRLVDEDIALSVDVAPDCGQVMADPGQLEQVVMNLVVNARDAMPSGGRLTIKADTVDTDGVHCVAALECAEGRYVRIQVEDTGHGMDKETLSRVFEPFFTTKCEGKGTGLGLSMVYGIVRDHGGWVSAYSEPGHGTVFKAYLPLTTEDAAVAETKRPVEPVSGRGRRILVVEDDEQVRRAAVRVLKGAGYEVTEAGTIAYAETLFEREPNSFSLALLDYVLPDGSGLDLAQKLASRAPGLKILFSSGYTDEKLNMNGITAGRYAFIQKPFDAQRLLETVRREIEVGSV